MSLIKKIVFGFFVALAIIVAIWAYLFLKNSKKPKAEALAFIPDNCLVYLKTNDFFELNKKINSQSLITDKLKLFGDVSAFCNALNAFDSVFISNSLLEEAITKNTLHFALYEKDLSWLATFNIKRLGSQDLIVTELAKALKARKIEKNNYVFSLNKSQNYFFTLNDGVAFISNSSNLINLSLNTATVKLQTDKNFIDFKSALKENAALSIFINHRLYLENKSSLKLNLSLFCKKGFSAGGIDLEPSQFTVNGFLHPDSSEIVSCFLEQTPQPADFLTYLPINTSSFKAYGFSSLAKINKQLSKFIPVNTNAYWKIVTDSALFNLEKEFYENTQNYLVEFTSKNFAENLILLKVEDTLKASEHLGYMSDSVFHDGSTLIYKLKTKGLKSKLKLFGMFFDIETSYAALYKSHLFFSGNKEDLTTHLTNLANGANLTNNESFMVYKNQNLSEEFNYLSYISPNKNKEDIKKFFSFESNSSKDPFENFKHFSFAVCANKNNFKFRCQLINETEMVNKEQNVLWTLKLRSMSQCPAFGFINHITKENELLIQDEDKNLYLINAKGTPLWVKKINEKITSKIFTVDIFKNNKYQLLFSSENYLHLVDRNGNYVQGYPVKLPAQSTSDLSVFDYDNTKDYRLFIACKNNTIYNYSIYGIKQDKFMPVKTETEVNLPIQYAKVGQSDYLVAIDIAGKIYTFSRKGEARIGLKNKSVENCSAFYIDATNNINSTYLIYVDDKNSLINKISFSDKKNIEKLSSEIGSASIKFASIDDNKATDILVTKSNGILAYNLNGNLLFEKTIGGDLTATDFYSDESHSLYLLFSSSKKELLLYDQLKQKIKSLSATAIPLISNLFNNNKKYLIVTDGQNLNCVAL